jgi:hypothetical protein
MAINVEVVELVGSGREPGGRNSSIELPANAITNVAAAGTQVLAAGTKRVKVRNRAGGDSVYCRVQATDGRANAAVGNSLLLAANQELDFTLPKSIDPTNYEVDIRAIA